jgi:large subunit ribosomal protein L29
MKASDLRDLTEEELKEKAVEAARELFNLRFQKATGQLGNTAVISRTKRNLARIKTVIREMEISKGVK